MTIRDLIFIFIGLLQLLIPLLISIAFLVFLWGIVKFIGASGSEEKRSEGKKFLIWGIVAMFVLMAIGGIISFLFAEFEFTVPGGPDRGFFFPIPLLQE